MAVVIVVVIRGALNLLAVDIDITDAEVDLSKIEDGRY